MNGRSSGFSVSGDPCSFVGTVGANKPNLVASAQEIIYQNQEQEQVLVFRGKVIFEKNGDTLEASSIIYDVNNQEISARSDIGDSPIRLVIKSR